MCSRRGFWFRHFMSATILVTCLLWQSWNPLLQELDCVMVWEKFVDVLVLSSHIIIQTIVFQYIYLSIPMLYYSPYHLLDIFFLATINYISISSVSARFSFARYEGASVLIKNTLDKKFGASWQCAVGEGFGFDISCQQRYLLHVYYGKVSILEWKFFIVRY